MEILTSWQKESPLYKQCGYSVSCADEVNQFVKDLQDKLRRRNCQIKELKAKIVYQEKIIEQYDNETIDKQLNNR